MKIEEYPDHILNEHTARSRQVTQKPESELLDDREVWINWIL
jgi:hypothetical protein